MENKNKPAFPNDKQYQLSGDDYEGLTKREYFAVMAMQGILSAYGSSGSHIPTISRRCVELADNLLIELEKNNK